MVEGIVSEAIIFLSAVIFVYFCRRIVILVRGSHEELRRVLDRDFARIRKLWL